MIKNLKSTQHMMCSSFYKSRFVAEFFQTKIRYDKLLAMVEKWDKGELPFTPTCPRELYDQQLAAMKEYLRVLEERANLENVNLAAFDNGMTFSQALSKLYAGERIALADWGGYWFLGPDQTIMLRTKDGQELDTPDFERYADREDWRIYDELNEANLREYESSLNSCKKP